MVKRTTAYIGKPQKSNKHKKIKQVQFDADILKEVVPRKRIRHDSRLSNSSKNNLHEHQNVFDLKEPNEPKEPKKKKKRGENSEANNFIPVSAPIPKVSFIQKRNESVRAFYNRMDVACRDVIEETTNPPIRENDSLENTDVGSTKKEISMKVSKANAKKAKTKKRLEHLKDKTQAKKDLKSSKNDGGFDHLTDKVAFGEVNMAPPVLKFMPPKAKLLVPKKAGNRGLLLSSMLNNSSSNKFYQKREIGKTIKTKNLTPLQQIKEQDQRKKYIDAYRKLKSNNKSYF